MSAEELVAELRHELSARRRARALCLELHDRANWTWGQIAAATGLHLSTVHRLARSQPSRADTDG